MATEGHGALGAVSLEGWACLPCMPDMPYWLRKAKAESPPNQSNNHCTASHKAEMSAASNVEG
jgi:hypothetical protein